MNMKKGSLFFVCLVTFILIVGGASALTVKFGNGVSVVRSDVGDEIERFIRIINDNDVSVTVVLEPAGELADNVDLIDNNFTLEPGEERKAYFTIFADEPGTFETQILVKFVPEEGNPVGLASRITVIASGDAIDKEDKGFFGGLFGGDDSDLNESSDDSNIEDDNNEGSENGNSNGLSILVILGISTTILAVIFLILVIILMRRKNNSSHPVVEKVHDVKENKKVKNGVKKSVKGSRGK